MRGLENNAIPESYFNGIYNSGVPVCTHRKGLIQN